MDSKNYSRQVAVKVTIKELLSGKYVQENESEPNYLLTENNQKIFRLNFLGTILSNEKQGSVTNILVDDSTGKISLRIFEENNFSKNVNIGEVVLVIGKLRMYNQERYVYPEIIKKIDPFWLKVRLLELKDSFSQNNNFEEMENIGGIKKNEEKLRLSKKNEGELSEREEIIEEKNDQIEDDEESPELLPVQKLVQLIKELDKGEGVPVEEIIEKSLLENTESILEKMLKEGIIFQNLPGKVKVL